MLTAFAGGALFGERVGSGSPRVLALHGWGHDHTRMMRVLEGFDGVSVDLPGFGNSPQPTEVWGAADYARALKPVLEEFDSPPVVLGHSFGGRVALSLAAQHPDKVQALVLTGVPLIRKKVSAKGPSLAFRLLKLAHKVRVISDERMEAERRKRGSADYRAATGIMRDVFVKSVNESYEDQLRAVSCPVELVWGENDTEARVEQAIEAKSLLARASMTIVPNGSHWLPQEDPEPVRDAIMRVM